MTWLDWLTVAYYIVTIIGLPYAISVFLYEQRQARQDDEEERHLRLSQEYSNFLTLVLQHADLQLLRPQERQYELSDEQKERKLAIFSILIALFERAYLLVYDEQMDPRTQRLWASWEEYMREWGRRTDFRAVLPSLLKGEDEAFRNHILRIIEAEEGRAEGR